ncbi:MAG: hypothetical protein ACMG57_05230 [Candidatus Dojkabacteria bacterium]
MEQETKAFLDENNWLEIVLGSRITEKDYIALITRVYDLALQLEDKDFPVKLLVDCSHLMEMEKIASELAVKGTRDLQFNQIASFGLDPKYIPLLQIILSETAKQVAAQEGSPAGITPQDLIKDFPTREEAERWLENIVT